MLRSRSSSGCRVCLASLQRTTSLSLGTQNTIGTDMRRLVSEMTLTSTPTHNSLGLVHLARSYSTAPAKAQLPAWLKALRDTSFKEAQSQSRPSSNMNSPYSEPSRGVAGPRLEPYGAGAGLIKPEWNKVMGTLPQINKVVYKEHPTVAAMTEQQVAEFREEHMISIIGSGCPKPIPSFEMSTLPNFLLSRLKQHKILTPTPIQSQAIPIALSGHDLVGRAETGSGKTLAFLLPACVHIAAQPPLTRGDGPHVLVMVPTRELALQIFQEAEKFAYIRENVLARTAVVYGGAGRGIQMEKLSLGPQLLIATPGRLLDFLEMGVTNLRRVSHVVLDEADRMLEIGMEDQLRKIIDQIRPDRQTTMYSATWPTTVQQLALDYLKNPIQVNVGHTGLKVPQTITQVIDVCDPLERNHKLVHLLKNSTQTDKILVFTKTKQTCDELAMLLRDYGHMPVALHGDKSQTVRESALRSFKQGHSSIMIATDVAARGLDIRNVTYVVNYDFPDTVENYVHRIGRTGRAGAEGIAYSFLTSSHFHLAPNLAKLLKEAGQEMDERLQQICNARAATVRDSYSSRPNYRQTSRPMFRSSPPPFKRQSQVRLFH